MKGGAGRLNSVEPPKVRYSPNWVIFRCLPAHGPWFCGKVGVQAGFTESKVLGVPAPSIL